MAPFSDKNTDSTEAPPAEPRVLLNISNHPSGRWPEGQLAAVSAWADEVVDMPFPHVSPSMDSDGIKDLAEQLLAEVENRSPRPSAVHLMGELTLTYRLVYLLQQKGFTVLASTTERRVLQEENGQKTSEFRFVRFREYLCPDSF
jgi:hypothetical protein